MRNMSRRTAILMAAAVGALSLSGLPALAQDTTTQTLEISGGFTRASPKVAHAGAGFMTIRSLGQADRLLGFRSPICTQPELHTHVNENGMMRMRQVPHIDIPAGGEAVLKPGSLHLMFINLTEPLEEGKMVPVTLVFEQAGEVSLELPVKAPGAMN